MSDQTHNISNSTTPNKSSVNPSLNFTEQELLEELDAYYHPLPQIQSGDLTLGDLEKLNRGSVDCWRKRIKKNDPPPGWEFIKVIGNRGLSTWVMRKIGT
jgi:hypothetical protein